MATREEWARRVERWVGSGLGANEFATREGVSSKQLSKWKWFLKLHARLSGPRRPQSRRLGQGLPAFAPVWLSVADRPFGFVATLIPRG